MLRICKGRAARDTGAKMIKPRLVALQPRRDLAQARSARQLTVKQGHELAPRRQPANARIGTVIIHQMIELSPWNML
jgi:hypothetical protein